MQRSVPEASAGFSRFDASMAPPEVAPAPITVWISSMNMMALGCASISLTTCFSAPRNRRGSVPARRRAHVECEHGRVLEHLRHFAVHDLARQALGDRGLADAGIADEERVVLLPAAEDLDGALTSASRPISGSILPSLAFLFRLTQ